MPEPTSGGKGDNSNTAPATPKVAPATKPEMPAPAASVPTTTQPDVTPKPKPVTFSPQAPKPPTLNKDQTPGSPSAEASEQPNKPAPEPESAQEEPKPESTEKDKEGDDFIKKFVEYLMKLIQSQLEEDEQKRKEQEGGASFGNSLVGIDPQQEQNDKNTKRFDRPKPKPSGTSMEEELNNLSKQYNKLGNSDDLRKFKDVLKDFATAFSPNKGNNSEITKEQDDAQGRLKDAIGGELLDSINKTAAKNPKFGENLGKFAENLNEFIDNPGIKNGIGVLSSALKIANPLAKAMSGVGGGQPDDPRAEQKTDSDQPTSQEPQGEKPKTKHPGSVPRGAPKLRPPGGGGRET